MAWYTAPREARRARPPDEVARGWGRSRVVALTGAGISRSSGLATRKELWRRYARDEAVSVWRFRERPSELWRVVADFLADGEPAPSEAHLALARLPGLHAVLTQNGCAAGASPVTCTGGSWTGRRGRA